MEQTKFEKRNGISIYQNTCNVKGLPKGKRNPEAIKKVLVDTLLRLLKSKISPSEFEKASTLIWDIVAASYEHGKRD